MSERDGKRKIIEKYEELNKRIDKYDRYYYYLITERNRPARVIMELIHTGNGYINGRYVNTDSFKTTKAGDINIKNLTDFELSKLIEEAIRNINVSKQNN